MNKLLKLYDTYALKALVAFLIVFTALYPKLPSVHIVRTWVYIRLEDFFIFATAVLWFIQLIRRKVTIPFDLGLPIAIFWAVGLISTVFSILFIGPHLQGFFSHLALLEYARRIEYMILFFVAFTTIKSWKDVRDYFVILCATLVCVVLYGVGQRYYLDLWAAFPKFFQKYSFCFPSFQTGNEEFAKGLPLCLPKEARINSTFGGHYDLAAYLVFILPIFIGVFLSIKKWYWRLTTFALYIGGLILLLFTASRTSFLAYVCGAVLTLIFYKKKWYIIPVLLISTILLFTFSGSTAKRLFSTFRISSVVTNSQGQIVGEALPQDLQNKISKNPVVQAPPPAQDLQLGSAAITLPQAVTPVATNTAVVKKTLTPEEAQKLKLANGSIELSTVSGTFLVKKALVYDISFTTRFQAEWPNAWKAFLRNPLLGSGYSTITLATDNDYFRALGETGLLGILSFILIFIIFGIALKEVGKHIESKFVKGFVYGLAGGVVGLALNAVLIDVFEASKDAENLWLLLGIATGGLMLYKQKKIAYLDKLKTVVTSNVLISMYLLVITFWAFLSSVSNFFVADDFTWLRWAASSNLSDLIKYFTDAHNFFYRPLDKLTIFGLYNFFGIRPEGYHTFILILNYFAALAVYFLAARIFKRKLLGFIAAVFFLINPAHSENVFWLSTISVTLSSVFMLYASLAFLRFREKKSIFSYFIAFVLSVLAFLSYEMAVVLPLLFVVLDIFVVHAKKNIKTILSYLPFVLLVPGYFVLRYIVHAFSGGGDYSYNIPHLIPNIIGNFFGYIGLFLSGEAFLPFYTLVRESFRHNIVLFALLITVAVILVFVLVKAVKQKIILLSKNPNMQIILFGLVFAFVALLPFLALGNIADRYLFLPSVGLSISFVTVLSSLIAWFSPNTKKANLIFAFIAVLFVLTYQFQNTQAAKDWGKAGQIAKNTLTLFRVKYDTLAPTANLYFVNTPMKYHNVWVFPVGLSDGLWIVYREALPQVHQVSNLNDAKAGAKANSAVTNYIFRFDKNNNLQVVE